MHIKKQPCLDQEQELLILPLPGKVKGIQLASLYVNSFLLSVWMKAG